MDGMIYNENAPKLRILSIDWDYFIDTREGERAWMFPDGGSENLPPSLQTSIWANHYHGIVKRDSAVSVTEANRLGYRNLDEITIDLPEAKKLAQIINLGVNPPIFFIAESHREMGNVFAQFWNSGNFGSVKIVNIDFHSDMYEQHLDEFNCGNWFYHIITQIGKINPANENTDNVCNEFIWVHRPDSSTDTSHDIPDSVRPYVQLYSGIDVEALSDEYDVVFICKSSMWSPPHLDQLFAYAVKPIQLSGRAFEFDNDVLIDRMEDVHKFIAANSDMYEQMRKLVFGDEGNDEGTI